MDFCFVLVMVLQDRCNDGPEAIPIDLATNHQKQAQLVAQLPRM
jgi:hypothetical protein